MKEEKDDFKIILEFSSEADFVDFVLTVLCIGSAGAFLLAWLALH